MRLTCFDVAMMINENESIEYVLCATIVAPGPNIIPLRPQKRPEICFPLIDLSKATKTLLNW